jgi:acetyl esterase/lipase
VDPTFFAAGGDPRFMTISCAFLAVAMVGAAFAVNAHRPFARRGRLSIPVFFAGWLTSELALWHIAWQAAATAAFARAGALAAWPGWIAAGLTLVSWGLLLDLFVRARRTRGLVEAALREALGESYRSRIDPTWHARTDGEPPFTELLLPVVARTDGVERIRNLPYGPHGRRNMLDVLRRKDRPTGCPVLVNVHGGAWIIGDKEQQARPLMHHLASDGWVCVSINYRLSPRGTFPDHIVDVKRALAWVKEHIAEYGGDPDFVVLSGGSAGGHLAALAALTAGDPTFQPGFEGADTRVRACVPFYGVYDFTNRSGKGRREFRPYVEQLVFKRRFDEAPELFDRASPMSHVSADAPPFLVVHGTNDTLVPVEEARWFVDLLRAASKTPVAYVELPLAQHAFEVFTSARTAFVIRGVARFLGVVLGDHLRAKANRLAPTAERAPSGGEELAAVPAPTPAPT